MRYMPFIECKGHVNSTCPPNNFRCPDGSGCRPIAQLCDGTADCADQWDEGSFCSKLIALTSVGKVSIGGLCGAVINTFFCSPLENVSQCQGAGCQHGCKPSITGPLCFCKEGTQPNGTDCIGRYRLSWFPVCGVTYSYFGLRSTVFRC